MRRLLGLSAAAALTAVGISGGAHGHHAFSAEFSRDMPIEVAGTVTKVEWMNPHARFYVEAEDENGEMIEWDFELASPNALMRRGWRHDSLKVGDEVEVNGWRARNHPHVGNTRSVKLADGREVFAGSSAEQEES